MLLTTHFIMLQVSVVKILLIKPLLRILLQNLNPLLNTKYTWCILDNRSDESFPQY